MDRDGILKLAKLARLHVDEDRVPALAEHLGAMLGHMDDLRKINLDGVEPMASVDTGTTPLRIDEPHESLPREDAFRNAPEVELDHFRIPRVIG